MRTLKLFLIALSLSFCVLGHGQNTCPEQIKIISYNIWNGLAEDPGCRPHLVKWLKSEAPDVVALQELCGFNEQKLSDLAAEYGHPYVTIIKEDGYPVGLTSREPIEVISKNLEGYWHGMLHVKTFGLDFIVTHLSPMMWRFRLDETKLIREYVEKNELKDYLLMGDLNAFSPFDADIIESHTPLKEQMLRWEKKHPQWGNMKGDQYDWSVISSLYAMGLEDIVKIFVPMEKRMSFPTAFQHRNQWGDEAVRMKSRRLDYILVSTPLLPYCKTAKVHNGTETEGISDHYPVSLILELPQND